MSVIERPLGMVAPPDTEHLDRYSLTAETMPTKPTPVVLGTRWYRNFDQPMKGSDGRWWIGRGDLGEWRGGHAVCLQPRTLTDRTAWHLHYDQGTSSSCVGASSSRAMTLLNRQRFDHWWLWDRSKERDGWPDTNPGDNEGTTIRAAFSTLKEIGHKPVYADADLSPAQQHGISTYRWATSVEQVIECLMSPIYYDIGGVAILNSWGTSYPRVTWMPLETLRRVITEYADCGLPTDR